MDFSFDGAKFAAGEIQEQNALNTMKNFISIHTTFTSDFEFYQEAKDIYNKISLLYVKCENYNRACEACKNSCMQLNSSEYARYLESKMAGYGELQQKGYMTLSDYENYNNSQKDYCEYIIKMCDEQIASGRKLSGDILAMYNNCKTFLNNGYYRQKRNISEAKEQSRYQTQKLNDYYSSIREYNKSMEEKASSHWYDGIVEIFDAWKEVGTDWYNGFSSLANGEGTEDLWKALKSTGSTLTVTGTSIASGFLKVGELLNDGVAFIEGSAVARLTWLFHDIWSDNDLAGKVIDDTLDYMRVDQVGKANKYFYENTEIGKAINANSKLKYDSKGAQFLQDTSKKATEIALATAATIVSGGAAAFAIGAVLGIGEAGENYAQSVDRENGESYNKGTALLNVGLGAVGKGFEFVMNGKITTNVLSILSNPSAAISATKSFLSENSVSSILKAELKSTDFVVDAITTTGQKVYEGYQEYKNTGDVSWGKLALSFAGELALARVTDKMAGGLDGLKAKSTFADDIKGIYTKAKTGIPKAFLGMVDNTKSAWSDFKGFAKNIKTKITDFVFTPVNASELDEVGDGIISAVSDTRGARKALENIDTPKLTDADVYDVNYYFNTLSDADKTKIRGDDIAAVWGEGTTVEFVQPGKEIRKYFDTLSDLDYEDVNETVKEYAHSFSTSNNFTELDKSIDLYLNENAKMTVEYHSWNLAEVRLQNDPSFMNLSDNEKNTLIQSETKKIANIVENTDGKTFGEKLKNCGLYSDDEIEVILKDCTNNSKRAALNSKFALEGCGPMPKAYDSIEDFYYDMSHKSSGQLSSRVTEEYKTYVNTRYANSNGSNTVSAIYANDNLKHAVNIPNKKSADDLQILMWDKTPQIEVDMSNKSFGRFIDGKPDRQFVTPPADSDYLFKNIVDSNNSIVHSNNPVETQKVVGRATGLPTSGNDRLTRVSIDVDSPIQLHSGTELGSCKEALSGGLPFYEIDGKVYKMCEGTIPAQSFSGVKDWNKVNFTIDNFDPYTGELISTYKLKDINGKTVLVLQ